MVKRISMNGILTVYSEDVYKKVVELAEEDELFSYISALINAGLGMQFLVNEFGTQASSSVTARKLVQGLSASQDWSDKVEVVELIATPVRGSASLALNKLRKINKK